MSFDKIVQNPLLLKNLTEKLGFKVPTPIQTAVAEPIREGRNIFAGAKTGSGKTIAFLAPLAERLLSNQLRKVLVLGPTRELVLQTDEEAMNLLDGQTEMVSVPLYGGVPVDTQILAMRAHRPRLFIATPGRVLDLFQEGVLKLEEIDGVVLDEADRMCDMGFAPQVTQIFDLLTNRKQTLLFSATLPKELNEIMNQFCPDAVRIQVDAADESSATIEHTALLVNRRDKIRKLIEILQPPGVTALIFTRTRNRCDDLYREINRHVKGVGILHAGYSMPERERTIRDFKEQKLRCLIATDVVSRGIDVEHITHVIHFDIPDQLEDYIHRSGRSGRAGRTGETIALVDRDSREEVQKIQRFGKKIHFTMQGQTDQPPRRSAPQQDRDSRGPERGPERGSDSRDPRDSRGRGPRHSNSRDRNQQRPRRSSSGPNRGGPHRGPARNPAAERPPLKAAAAKPAAAIGILQKTKSLFGKMFGLD